MPAKYNLLFISVGPTPMLNICICSAHMWNRRQCSLLLFPHIEPYFILPLLFRSYLFWLFYDKKHLYIYKHDPLEYNTTNVWHTKMCFCCCPSKSSPSSSSVYPPSFIKYLTEEMYSVRIISWIKLIFFCRVIDVEVKTRLSHHLYSLPSLSVSFPVFPFGPSCCGRKKYYEV